MRAQRSRVVVALGALGLAGLFLTTVAILGLGGFQAALVVIAPQMQGFERIGRVYIERGMNPNEAAATFRDLADAKSRVDSFLGPMHSRPIIFVCQTERCFERLVGPSKNARGLSVHDRTLILSPRRIGSVIAAHELAHIELHERAGLGSVAAPAWFDEGLATLVSQDTRYLSMKTDIGLCANDARDLPANRRAWSTAAKTDQSIYAAATCRVAQCLRDAEAGDKVMQLILKGELAGASRRCEEMRAASRTRQ